MSLSAYTGLMPTMEDVAELSGLSRVTVSKVLNIGWIGDALSHQATTICSRSNRCPRPAHSCH